MKRKLLTLTLMLAAALLVACGGSNAGEPSAALAESQPESPSGVTGAAGDTGDAQTGESAAGHPRFIEFYADW